MKLSNKKINNISGFSLAEVMVAVGIVSFVALSLVNVDKIFQQGVKQNSGKLAQQKLVTAIDKLLYSTVACTNTFQTLNPWPRPALGETPTPINELRDDNNTVILRRGDIYGGADIDGNTETGRLVIEDMYISNYQDITTDQANHYNRDNEFTFTVVLSRDDSGRVRTLIERFKIRAELDLPDDASGVLSACGGEPPINLSEVCDLFQGTFDGATELCRSLYVADTGGVDLRPGPEDDLPIDIENTNINVYGSTLLEGDFTLFPFGTALSNGNMQTDQSVIFRDDVMVGDINFYNLGPDVGDPGFPGAGVTPLITNRNIMFLTDGLAVGVAGNSVPPNDLVVGNNISAGSAYISTAPARNADSDVSNIGLVREMLSQLLSQDPADATAILNDASDALDTTNTVGDSAIRYVCSLASVQISLRVLGGGALTASSFSAPRSCAMDMNNDGSLIRNNCQIDSGESAAANQAACSTLHAGTAVYVGTGAASNRIENWNINEFSLPAP